MKKWIFVGVIILAAMTFGCATYVPPPPPPVRIEVKAARPHPKAVWIHGHWAWRGKRAGYVWVPGHWKRYR